MLGASEGEVIVGNRYLEGNFAPVREEVTAFDLPVTGTIPPDLEGRLLRIGPNPIEPGDPETYHWFTGTGMVHGVRIAGGKAAWYRNRYVLAGKEGSQTSANTNVIGLAGKTFAIVEAGGPPVELSYELDPLCVSDFDDTLPAGFTAHPKRDPVTGELHACAYSWQWNHIQYLVIGADGRVRKVIDVPVPGKPMVHDIAITESQIVLFDLPVTFNIEAAMKGARFPYQWDPDYGARVGLLPRHENASADDVRWYDVEPCYVFHPLNAYDLPGGRVAVDLVRHPKMFATDHVGPNEGPTTLDRWSIDPSSGKVIEERLDDRPLELPRHDERRLGRPYRYGYAISFGQDSEHGPTIKHDLVAGTSEIHDYGPGRMGLEPVFVPAGPDSAEDDGWVMVYVYDAASDRSDVVILHSQDFGGEPVATIHLPARVPFGFHGNWVPDRPG